MKIFITSTGNSLKDKVDPKFGRCDYYIIYDTVTKGFESKENPYKTGQTSVGISLAQTVIKSGSAIAISTNFGPNAHRVLKESDIKMFKASESMSVEEAIKNYIEGKLKEVISATSHEQADKIFPHHHEEG
jgi:predicted Fe-Mo cluster-binding NifX family protein